MGTRPPVKAINWGLELGIGVGFLPLQCWKIAMNLPLVTILMPMRNAEAFVEQALRSLLRSQRVALEVIVIDNQSRDQIGRAHV